MVAYQYEQVRIDKRRAYQRTKQFKNQYRFRSGIEATNSQLARIGLKRLRVRRLKSTSFKNSF
ncbi:MAG: transposase [Deltaproteobacteria bacterium]|nr:transposase [Deltaproteobacteria bacterium]